MQRRIVKPDVLQRAFVNISGDEHADVVAGNNDLAMFINMVIEPPQVAKSFLPPGGIIKE